MLILETIPTSRLYYSTHTLYYPTIYNHWSQLPGSYPCCCRAHAHNITYTGQHRNNSFLFWLIDHSETHYMQSIGSTTYEPFNFLVNKPLDQQTLPLTSQTWCQQVKLSKLCWLSQATWSNYSLLLAMHITKRLGSKPIVILLRNISLVSWTMPKWSSFILPCFQQLVSIAHLRK